MIKKIAIALVILIAIVILLGLVLPTEFEVSRSEMISAEPEKIHVFVDNLYKWDSWNLWRKDYSYPFVRKGDITSGVGAQLSWTHNGMQCSLTFTQSSPDKGIEYRLFLNNKKTKYDYSIQYDKVGESTKVVWTIKGDWDYYTGGGYQALLADYAIGQNLERDLRKLKLAVERN